MTRHVWFVEKKKETIQHIVLECDRIDRNPCEGNVRLPEALGFKDKAQEVNYKAVELTKRRSEYWWKKSREDDIT